MKKFKTKITSLVLTLAMLVSAIICVPTAYASDTVYYTTEDFSVYTTNAAPDGITIGSGTGLVLENEDRTNKYLGVSAKKGSITFSQSFKYEADIKDLKFSIDAGFEGELNNAVISLVTDSGKFTVAQLAHDKGILAYDGKKLGTLSSDTLTTLLFAFSGEYNRYSVYANGKCIARDYYITSSLPQVFTGFEISGEINGETSLFADNIYAYSSDKIINSNNHPSSYYNDDSVEILEYEDIFYADRRMLQIDNFEGDPRAYHEDFRQMCVDTYPYDNVIAHKNDDDGNSYLSLETKSGNKNSFIVFSLGNQQRAVIEFDVCNLTNTAMLFRAYDEAGNFATVLSCDTTLKLVSNEQSVGTLPAKKWVRLSIILDNVAKTVNMYIDGEHTGVDIPMDFDNLGELSRVRFYPRNSHDENTIMVDNYIAYTGTELYDYSATLAGEFDENATVYNHNTKGVTEFLKNYNAIHTVTGKLYTDAMGKVTKMPYWENDILYVALPDAEALVFGSPASASEEFVALEEFAHQNGKEVTYNATNTVLVGDKQAVISDLMIKQVNAFMTYDRPSASDLVDSFTSSRPRLSMSAGKLAEIKSEYGNDKYITKWANSFIKSADGFLDIPPVEYVSPTGAAGRILTPARNACDRVQKLALAYHLTGEKKYVDRAWTELEHVCVNFPNWHEGVHGLDSAMMAGTVAYGYDWLYDQWTDEQRKIMEDAIYAHQLDISRESYHGMRDYGAIAQDNNWNPHANGYTAMAALAIFESNPAICADIISNAIKCLDYAILDFYPNGAWKEGPGYWNGTVQPLVELCPSLINAFGSSYNIENTACLDITCDYIIGNAGPVGNNNYNDAKEEKIGTNVPFMWCANTFGKSEYTVARLNEIENGVAELNILDLLLYDTNTSIDKTSTKLDYYFGDMELVSFRSAQGDPNATFVSFHSGNNRNADSHSHIDSGTFVLDMMGERFARETGSHYYFSEGHGQSPNMQPNNETITRWNYYNHIPEGHNTLVINPDDKTMGQNIITDDKMETVVMKPRGAYAITSLASAYKGFAKDVRRGIMLGDDRRSVTIRDEIKLNEGENDVYWFMQTGIENEIEYVDDKTVIMNQNGKKVKMTLLTDAASWDMSEGKCIQMYLTPAPEQQQIENLKRFAIHLKAKDSVYIQVKFIPLDDPAANNPQENIPLDSWSVPDGELQELPYLNSLKLNGEATEAFRPDAPACDVPVDVTTTAVPSLTWDIDDKFEAEITKYAANIDDYTTIRVWRKDDPSLYRIYTITFNPYEIKGLEPYKVTPVTSEASDIPQPENGPANIYDNNLETYWGASGKDKWIIADLGEVKQVDFIGTAFKSGDARVTTYQLFISEDKENWEMVFDGVSSGASTDIELSEKIGKKARYIKLVGFGNTKNEWNSITELCAYSLGF